MSDSKVREAIEDDKKFYNGYLKKKTTLKTRFVGGLFSLVLLGVIFVCISLSGNLPPAFDFLKTNANGGYSITFMGVLEILVFYGLGFALPKVFLWISKIFSIFSRHVNGNGTNITSAEV